MSLEHNIFEKVGKSVKQFAKNPSFLSGLLSASLLLTTKPILADDFIPPQNIVRGNGERPEVALTFDCGPWVERSHIFRILNALDLHESRVTFFVTGEFIRKNPDIFEMIVKRNHEIANHSFSHPYFTQISPESEKEELDRTEELINLFGASSKPMWRSPFGAFNNDTIWNAAYNGYWLHIMWTLDSGDWQDISSDTVEDRVVNMAGTGSIVVSHCNSWQTAQRLNTIIERLKNERGLTVTTVTSLLRSDNPN